MEFDNLFIRLRYLKWKVISPPYKLGWFFIVKILDIWWDKLYEYVCTFDLIFDRSFIIRKKRVSEGKGRQWKSN